MIARLNNISTLNNFLDRGASIGIWPVRSPPSHDFPWYYYLPSSIAIFTFVFLFFVVVLRDATIVTRQQHLYRSFACVDIFALPHAKLKPSKREKERETLKTDWTKTSSNDRWRKEDPKNFYINDNSITSRFKFSKTRGVTRMCTISVR